MMLFGSLEGLKEEVEAKTKTYYTTANLRVRMEPGTDAEIITTLPKGKKVRVISITGDWAKINYEEEECYVAKRYLVTQRGKKIVKKPLKVETKKGENGYLVVIDAGHQRKANTEKEPIGPNAKQTKFKVTGGTRGVSTGLYEFELALTVSLRLEEELKVRGYEVVMVRTSHDVNLSNAERADIANKAGADAFIRIHANGANNPKVNGAMTICQTPNNRFNGELYEKSRSLSDHVLEEMTESAGCKKLYVWETDTMSGVNWAKVPTTIVEMGYMTNPKEDELMATEEYQDKLVKGMAEGIDKFLGIE